MGSPRLRIFRVVVVLVVVVNKLFLLVGGYWMLDMFSVGKHQKYYCWFYTHAQVLCKQPPTSTCTNYSDDDDVRTNEANGWLVGRLVGGGGGQKEN